MTDIRFLYITASSRDEALQIGRALVDERLAACANVIEEMTSIYRWEGKIHEDAETVLIAKTRGDLVDRLISRVRELHSYTCPCVVALPVVDGFDEYLGWITRETRDSDA